MSKNAVNDQEKINVKKRYKKGEAYIIIRNLVIGAVPLCILWMGVDFLSHYVMHAEQFPVAKYYMALALVPILLIVFGQREWQRVCFLHSEIMYEEEHGHPRKKSVIDRELEKRKHGL